MNTDNVTEIVLFRAAAGVTDEQMIAQAERMNPLLIQQPGYKGRTLGKTPEGVWIDTVYWDSMEAAHKANDVIMKMSEAADFMQLIDVETIQMNHFYTHYTSPEMAV